MKIIEAIKKLKNKIPEMDEEKTLDLNCANNESENKIKWCSIEKNPPASEDVLLRTESGFIFIGYYSISDNCYLYDDFNFHIAIKKDSVVAWCPIPKYDLKD